MKKLKVVTVVGTRPEIIRLSRVLHQLDSSAAIEHTLIHTGQNYDYELNQIFFDDLGLRQPDHYLDAAGKTATETIGQILIRIDSLLDNIRPDAFLVLGDTNSCLCAIPAKKKHIPIFHMEAGNRCFDFRVPEETNRRIVDHISDINLTYSSIARDYLLREGLPPDRIIKTGSPMFEVLTHYKSRIDASTVLQQQGLTAGNYFVVSAHREENINSEKNFTGLIDSLKLIADTYHLPIIFSAHPRTRKMIEEKKVALPAELVLLKPLSFSDYNALQVHAKAVLSDSGTISEESSILDFPALNIRESHERPEAMEETSAILTGLRPERILQGLQVLATQEQGKRQFRQVADYSMPNVSEKILRIILSYTDYVKRNVWREEM